MGLSFHDETSLIEAAGSLRFAAGDPYPVPLVGIRNINQANDSIWENDDTQEGRSTSETSDKFIELEDNCIDRQRDPVDSMVEIP